MFRLIFSLGLVHSHQNTNAKYVTSKINKSSLSQLFAFAFNLQTNPLMNISFQSG